MARGIRPAALRLFPVRAEALGISRRTAKEAADMRQTQILRRARKQRQYDEPAAAPVVPNELTAAVTAAAAAAVDAIDAVLES
jgi:hypothetical protein